MAHRKSLEGYPPFQTGDIAHAPMARVCTPLGYRFLSGGAHNFYLSN